MSTVKDEIRDLLEPGTLDQADASLARLETLLDEAKTEASDLHAAADALLVDEPAEAERLESEAKDADRKARRCVLAIERVTERRAELVADAEAAELRTLCKRGTKAEAVHLEQHSVIGRLLREIEDSIGDYTFTLAEIQSVNERIKALGGDVRFQPAHDALHEPEETERQTVEVHENDVSLAGGSEYQARSIATAGEPFIRRRTETVVIKPARTVPDYSRCKMHLPHPEDARAWLIRRDG